jgi:hypothetical protein
MVGKQKSLLQQTKGECKMARVNVGDSVTVYASNNLGLGMHGIVEHIGAGRLRINTRAGFKFEWPLQAVCLEKHRSVHATNLVYKR